MVLSRRERYIAIGTILVVALLVLDHFALSPIFARFAALRTEKRNYEVKLDEAKMLLQRQAGADARWKEMVAGGLKQDATETQSALERAVTLWADEAGLTIVYCRPQRNPQQGPMPELGIYFEGTGKMKAVANFLWRAQTSPLPVKVEDLVLASRREATDDLRLTLHMSGLYLPADWKVPAAGGPASGGTHK